MMNAGVRSFRKFAGRGQSGQSILILAIGFIALLGFVGIVTDVSLLFVRYSTLRRAVDAAAIAAAGQIRREIAPGMTENQIQGDSLANLNLAARSFIEMYNLDPSNVLVETCYAQNVLLLGPNGETTGPNRDRPADRNGVPLYTYDAGGTRTGDNALANADDRFRYEELCTRDELKLVRVTAQLQSPTVFLRLLGFGSITVQSSAISQTAVIDVVLILDVSESMAYDTTYASYEPTYNWRYFPPQFRVTNVGADWAQWNDNLPRTQAQINALMTNADGQVALGGDDIPQWVPTGQTATSEIRAECRVRYWPRSAFNAYRVSTGVYAEYTARGYNTGRPPVTNPANSNYRISTGFVPSVDYYGCCNDPNGDGNFTDLVCDPFRVARDSAATFLERLDFVRGDRVAFVTFDRSAYLVDPDGSATSSFQGLSLSGLQNPFIETLNNIDAPRNEDDRVGAAVVLDQRIGVRAEPNFYVDSNADGQWDGFRTASPDAPRVTITLNSVPTEMGFISFATASNFYANTIVGRMFDHPVRESCFLDGAFGHNTYSLIDFYTTGTPGVGRFRNQTIDAGNESPLDDVLTPRNGTTDNPYVPYQDLTSDDGWLFGAGRLPPNGGTARRLPTVRNRSYELRAGCGGTNMAAGIETAGTTFYRYGRREGSVWIMVLLSDGAAGTTDPILRQYPDNTFSPPDADNLPDERTARQPDPYFGFSTVTQDVNGLPQSGYATSGVLGDYGAFGLCPYGSDITRAQMLAQPNTAGVGSLFNNTNAELLRDLNFPFCGDLQPQSRHFCSPGVINPRQMAINRADAVQSAALDNVLLPCERVYDVEDYARDWADFIGLAGLNASGGGQLGDQRLPTIFTIAFGLGYAITPGTSTQCATIVDATERLDCNARVSNPDNYLGEEMLRYIADVGDNNRIDNDYWQAILSVPSMASPMGNFTGLLLPRIPNSVDGGGGTFNGGPRDPCELPDGTPGVWSPQQPTLDCGNYFNVADANDSQGLDAVFNEIASRMFLRLAQ